MCDRDRWRFGQRASRFAYSGVWRFVVRPVGLGNAQQLTPARRVLSDAAFVLASFDSSPLGHTARVAASIRSRPLASGDIPGRWRSQPFLRFFAHVLPELWPSHMEIGHAAALKARGVTPARLYPYPVGARAI